MIESNPQMFDCFSVLRHFDKCVNYTMLFLYDDELKLTTKCSSFAV
jgi:hypothetical protein